jgi:hypothetical protein
MFSSIASTCFGSFLRSLGRIPSHAAPLDHVGVIPDAYFEKYKHSRFGLGSAKLGFWSRKY